EGLVMGGAVVVEAEERRRLEEEEPLAARRERVLADIAWAPAPGGRSTGPGPRRRAGAPDGASGAARAAASLPTRAPRLGCAGVLRAGTPRRRRPGRRC